MAKTKVKDNIKNNIKNKVKTETKKPWVKTTKIYSALTNLNKKQFYKLYGLQLIYLLVLVILLICFTRFIIPNALQVLETSFEIRSGTIDQALLPQYTDLLKESIRSLLYSVIVLFLAFLVTYNFFNFYYWKLRIEKKWDWKKFGIFFASNSVLFIVLLSVLTLLARIIPLYLQSILFLLILFPLFVFITTTYQYFYVKNYNFKVSLMNSLNIIGKHIYKFLLPALLLFIPYIIFMINILFVLYSLIQLRQPPSLLMAIIFLLVYGFFINLCKYYFYSIIEDK